MDKQQENNQGYNLRPTTMQTEKTKEAQMKLLRSHMTVTTRTTTLEDGTTDVTEMN